MTTMMLCPAAQVPATHRNKTAYQPILPIFHAGNYIWSALDTLGLPQQGGLPVSSMLHQASRMNELGVIFISRAINSSSLPANGQSLPARGTTNPTQAPKIETCFCASHQTTGHSPPQDVCFFRIVIPFRKPQPRRGSLINRYTDSQEQIYLV